MKRLFIYIFLLSTATSVSGQKVLSLHEAISLALQHSLEIKLGKNNVETNAILNDYGIAGGLPVVAATLSDNEQITSINQKLNTGVAIQRNAAAANNFAAGITGSVLLYNGNRVLATKSRLAVLVKQSEQKLNAQIQNVLANVMVDYFDIVRQQSYLSTIEKSIDASLQQLQIVQTRQSVGLANNADLFQAQIDLNALQQAKQSQLLVIEQAKTVLSSRLNFSVDSTIEIKDSIVIDSSIQLKAVLINLNKNTDLLAAADQIAINQYIAKETAALRYPSLRATTGFNFVRNNATAGQLLLNQNYGPFVGLSVGIPIYNGSVFKRQRKVATIDVQNAELNLQILQRNFTQQVLNTFQAYTITQQQLQYEKQNYILSNQLLSLVLQRFQLKQATIVEVKNAQQSFEASGYRLVNLQYAAKTAEIELKRLSNQLAL